MTKNQGQNSTQASDRRELSGGCHCQAVQFRLTVAADTVILNCNCSVCRMTGFQHLVVPHPQFTLLQGQDALSSYRFNTGQANHLFCRHCGVKSFYQPRSHADCWSVNTHCLDDFNPDQWTQADFDGQNWEQAHRQLEE
ncbi:GFA family protein [Marinicella meishanensis]|uniref:GFA family protein n=1 Tax=Marinicella meishanensis TaxID=2873263 RepID=UPI001CC1332C|nr:GFA family protein [Marinicella sp. NBU2979]